MPFPGLTANHLCSQGPSIPRESGYGYDFQLAPEKKYEIFVWVGKPTMEKRKILERGGDYLGGFFKTEF